MELYHHIRCPFNRPGYFVGVVAILGDTVTLVDTGVAASPEEAILPFLQSMGRQVSEITQIVLTHSHGDHAGGVPALVTASPARVYVHELEAAAVKGKLAHPARVTSFRHGDVLELSGRQVEVIHLPGHSAGSVCLFDRELGLGISGDSVQGGGPTRPLLFYSAAGYRNALERLAQVPLQTLMLGHPYEPFGQGVIRGAQVPELIAASRQALAGLTVAVERVLRQSGRPLTVDEIVAAGQLQVRPVSVQVVLEGLAQQGKVQALGEAESRLWLA